MFLYSFFNQFLKIFITEINYNILSYILLYLLVCLSVFIDKILLQLLEIIDTKSFIELIIVIL